MRTLHILPAALLGLGIQPGLLLTISPWFWTGAELSRPAWGATVVATVLMGVALAWPKAGSRRRRSVLAAALLLLAGTYALLKVFPSNGNGDARALTVLAAVFCGLATVAQWRIVVERDAPVAVLPSLD